MPTVMIVTGCMSRWHVKPLKQTYKPKVFVARASYFRVVGRWFDIPADGAIKESDPYEPFVLGTSLGK